jgi:hypothetical protein
MADMVAIIIQLVDFGNQIKPLAKLGRKMFAATGMLENPKIEGCPPQRRRSAVHTHR